MTRTLLRLARIAVPARLRRIARDGVTGALDRVRPPTLAERIARLERSGGGRLLLAARNLCDGRSIAFGGDVPVPLASTVKLPLAVALLARVDAGDIALDASVVSSREHRVFGDGPLDVLLRDAPERGVTHTIAELLGMAIVDSDNTATDRLFDLVGGPAEVQRHAERLGARGLRVDRTIGRVLADRLGLAADAGGDRVQASRAFLADPRDTTTPVAMTELLAAIHAGAGLSPSCARLLGTLMQRCRTSPTRIRCGVPPGSVVAHKTGSLPREVSADVALVTLPGGPTIALAIYLRGSLAASVDRDGAIAGAARLAIGHLVEE